MSSPMIPSPFIYGDIPAGGQFAPIVVAARVPSNTIDKQYQGGYFWLSSLDMYTLNAQNQRVYGDGSLWFQAGNSSGHPNWKQITSALLTSAGTSSPPVINALEATAASPMASAHVNASIGAATFTGFKTAPYATQIFIIENSAITPLSKLLVSVANEGSADARMVVHRVKRLAGSFEVHVTNAGTANLNGNVTITFQKVL